MSTRKRKWEVVILETHEHVTPACELSSHTLGNASEAIKIADIPETREMREQGDVYDMGSQRRAKEFVKSQGERAMHVGKRYDIYFQTPALFREFKCLAAMNHARYGLFVNLRDALHPWGRYWIAPVNEAQFRELLEACQGTAEECAE